MARQRESAFPGIGRRADLPALDDARRIAELERKIGQLTMENDFLKNHMPEADRHALKYRMRVAYEAAESADARRLLYQLHDELLQSNPSAAASLAEGLDECLTVSELRLTRKLRQALSSTNCIESGFCVVDSICQQVKRWQGSDHRLRWVGPALLFAESRWNRIHGYRHMPVLLNALNAAHRLRRAHNQAELKDQVSAA